MDTVKHSKMSSASVWLRKLSWLSVIVCLAMTPNVCLALDEKPPQEISPVSELLELRADRSFLLKECDKLTVDLEMCETLLVMAEENPPACEGFPWAECVWSVLLGAMVGFALGGGAE